MSVVQKAENSNGYEITPEYRSFIGAVDRELVDIFHSLYGGREINNELTEYSLETVFAGGKRFRPMVYKAAADAFDVEQSDTQKARVGSIPEWIHTETLNLDDWQDDDQSRRGQKTPHLRLEDNFGLNPHTVGSIISNHVLGLSAGVYGYVQSMDDLPEEYRLDLIDVMSRAETDLVKGQNMDIVGEYIDDENVDTNYLLSENTGFVDQDHFDFRDFYIDMIDRKTGALVRAPLEAAALAAGYDYGSDVMDNIQDAGDHIARAFQKWDDVLDVTSNQGEIGKDRFSDLDASKKTIVSEAAAARLENGKKGFLEKVRRKEYPTENELVTAGRMIEESGAVETVREDAISDVGEAKRLLDNIPFENPSYVEDLKELADFAVRRDN